MFPPPHPFVAESTNERVLHMSALSMLFLVGLAVWQVLYLKSYVLPFDPCNGTTVNVVG